jgi:hypothetical protein
MTSDGDTAEDCIAGGCSSCELPHMECDDLGVDPVLEAFGLACPDRMLTNPALFTGPLETVGVRTAVGDGSTYLPREGANFVVLGTGRVADLFGTAFCGASWAPDYAYENELPDPIRVNNVGTQRCDANPALIGTGDCSNTIESQFSQAPAIYDYSEIRFTSTVPDGATSVKFDFAFLSSEWPEFFGQPYNDMFIGWLESELWTGNISFDNQSNPISLNAGFFDHKDTAGNLPEFAGTCMAGHAGTDWLTSTAAVMPGEEITMVFAIMDLGDGDYDSFVLLDNFRWGCFDGVEGPMTMGDTDTDGSG